MKIRHGIFVFLFLSLLFIPSVLYSYNAPDPLRTFYGDATGDMSVAGDDLSSHRTVASGGSATYATTQPQTAGQYWNTCDLSGDGSCAGDDIPSLISVASGGATSYSLSGWGISNYDLNETGNTIGVSSPFRLSVAAGSIGRPGIIIKVTIESDSTTTGSLVGRTCTPGSDPDELNTSDDQCAVAVTVTDFYGDTSIAPTESGTTGLQIQADGAGTIHLLAEVIVQTGMLVPAMTLDLYPHFEDSVLPTAITAGLQHTCALTSSGGVKCWGYNDDGQLGDNSTTQRDTPVDVYGLTSGATATVAGRWHSCALTSSGGVKCWGYNANGQLGDNSTTRRLTPVDVVDLSSGVAAISAGGSHTCVLTSGGGVKCWGDNYYGQLGDNTTTQRLTPVDVYGLTSGVTAISTGYAHTCALTTDQGVKCWGWNIYGELGDNSTTKRVTPVDVVGLSSGVTAISAGPLHTCALISGGEAKCWGYNSNGQIGDNSKTNRLTPVNVVGLSSGVTKISGGRNHTCALTSSEGVKCWGDNSNGQLGDNSTTGSLTPVDVYALTSGVSALSAGYFHACALKSDGVIKCWGSNKYGQIGDNGINGMYLTPIDVPTLSDVAEISAGNLHNCEINSVGGMKCWGYNSKGQIGDNSTTTRFTPVNVTGLSSGVTAISGGGDQTCALITGGGVKCWGWNFCGALGDNSTTDRWTPVDVCADAACLTTLTGITAISGGWSHTCALTSGGAVKCWGANWSGQIGDNSIENRWTPVDVCADAICSTILTNVTAISAGYAHTCALISDESVRCWGYNSYGQLGNNTTEDSWTPVDICADATCATALTGVTAITTGLQYTCALTSGGGVKCWGNDDYGQLGDNSNSQQITPVDVVGLSSGVTTISTKDNHTCALTSGGGVKCWGWNLCGALGDNSTTDRWTPVDVVGLSSGVSAISAGGRNTCALTSGGGVKCWGDNDYGGIGIGPWYRVVPVDVLW